MIKRVFGPMEGNDRTPDGNVRSRIIFWWLWAGWVVNVLGEFLDPFPAWIEWPGTIAVAALAVATAAYFTRRPVAQVTLKAPGAKPILVTTQLPADHAVYLIRFMNRTNVEIRSDENA